jgi:acyl-CoA synthetase (AMP-forming)/AMP-acid ligase II
MDSTIHGTPLADECLGPLTLGGFLREVCRKNAGKEAMVFHAGGGQVVRRSYAEVLEEALVIARVLVARGITKDSRVGVLCTNRPEWVTAVFGIALAGGICVPISTFAKREELEYMLRVADVSLLIFERTVLKRDFAEDLLAFCPELGAAPGKLLSPRLPFLRGAICIDDKPAPAGALVSWPDFLGSDKVSAELVDAIGAEVAPTDRALIFFSSGTTARPKAILHSHRAAAIQCWRWRGIFNVDPDVRTWAANGYFWSGNFCMAIGTTFAAGGSLVLQRYFDPGEALRLMQDERVTLPIAWPHQWPQLSDHPDFRKMDLGSLRYVGEISTLRTHPAVKTGWQEPVHAYGSTETFTLVAAYPSGTAPDVCAGTNGVPLPGNTLRVVEPLSGRVLSRGEAGEIAVKGPTLMLGYLRLPAEETFDSEGFFRTGDGGFVDAEGRLHWQGRLNDIIKTGGANVSPLEIDAVLRECPGIKVAATVGIPHDTLGEMVVACVVTEEGHVLDEGAVRAYAGERLSSYKVPRRVVFIKESDIELSSSNKVKTAPLRELAAKSLAAIN